ncbi:hypothetical protein CEE75_11125 [Lactobacillus crispatus]|jgi:hypothetical protein|uniref:Uncharacterized protein n=1 Tax=Lactobacillus crispatus TaxID=47770 RepID=A0A4V3BI50_9LACO|nr:hypothetical protein CEE75_11125 [Lactobacillus crispatus]
MWKIPRLDHCFVEGCALMRPSDNHFEIREILDAIAVAVERGELSQPLNVGKRSTRACDQTKARP